MCKGKIVGREEDAGTQAGAKTGPQHTLVKTRQVHFLLLAGTKAILEVEGGIQGWVEREGGEQGAQPEQACYSSLNPWILSSNDSSAFHI